MAGMPLYYILRRLRLLSSLAEAFESPKIGAFPF
jgi:hypothetical protein